MSKRTIIWMGIVILIITSNLITGCGGGGSSNNHEVETYDFTKTQQQSIKDIGEVSINKPENEDLTSAEPELYDNVIMNDEWIDSLTNITEDEMNFVLDTNEIFSFSTGEIFIVSEKQSDIVDFYPFKKISSIDRFGNEIAVGIEDVKIDEVIKYGEIIIDVPVTSEDFSLPDNKYSPIRKSPISSESSIFFDFEKEIYSNTNTKLTAFGDVDLKMSFLLNLKFYDGFNYFYTGLRTQQDSNFGLRATATGQISDDAKEFTIGKLVNTKVKFMAVLPPAPPIPVWIDVEIPFNIGMTGDFNATAEVSVNYVDNARFGVIYTQVDDTWDEIREYDKNLSNNKAEITGNGNLKFYAGPKLNANFYSVLGGPRLSLYAGVYNEIDIDANEFKDGGSYPLKYEWGIRTGIQSDFEASLQLFTKELSAEFNLSDPATNLGWDLTYGPKLSGLVLSNDEINIEKDKSTKLTDLNIGAIFNNSEIEIPNNVSNWSLENDFGSYNSSTGDYIAPDSDGIADLKYVFEHKNKYWDTKDTAEVKLKINVGEVAENTLTIVKSKLIDNKPSQLISDDYNNLFIVESQNDEHIGIFKYNDNLEKIGFLGVDNFIKIAIANNKQNIIKTEEILAKEPDCNYTYKYQKITKYKNNLEKENSMKIAFGKVDADEGHPLKDEILPEDFDINLGFELPPTPGCEVVEDNEGNLYCFYDYDFIEEETYKAFILKINWSEKTFTKKDLKFDKHGKIAFANNRIYIATQKKIIVYDTSLNKITDADILSGNDFERITQDLKISPDGNKLYILNISGDNSQLWNILVYDINSQSIEFDKTIEIPNSSSNTKFHGLGIDENYLYLTVRETNKIIKYSF
ncbi:MAG: YncE family protein [Candidatus Muiribacteriota bacterium]